ncbi:hypothetical protein LH53_09755 [Mesotoga sp. TolDC]|nr:hypothetical protein LH53_09755 [Mesotoga sp. TolDC]
MVFGITLRCHPELDQGSGSKNEQPRTGFFSAEDGGPLTGNAVFISDQRVFDLKRTAVLRIAMLKQVQTDCEVFRTILIFIPLSSHL